MNEVKINITKAMLGLSLLGKAMQGDTMVIATLLIGDIDDEVRTAFIHSSRTRGIAPEDYTAEVILADVLMERTKNMFRSAIQNMINDDENARLFQVEQKRKATHASLLKELQESNKQHPMGTVDQLAKRFGVSKSEIRRRKTDGISPNFS